MLHHYLKPLSLFLIATTLLPAAQFPLPIYPDSARMDKVGYGGGIKTNGELLLIKRCIKMGDIVFDVGANVGVWSTAAYQAHKNIQIFAFEPIPAAYEQLKQRVSRFSTRCFPIALNDQNGSQSFVSYKKIHGKNSLDGSSKSSFFHRPILEQGKGKHHHRTIAVETMTLDTFCEMHNVDHIDFLKIDTEGAEYAILQGADKLLQNHKINYIQFEYGGCYKDAKTTLQDVYTHLTLHGYSVFRIAPKGLIHITAWRPQLENYHYSNYCAIAPDKAPEFFDS